MADEQGQQTTNQQVEEDQDILAGYDEGLPASPDPQVTPQEGQGTPAQGQATPQGEGIATPTQEPAQTEPAQGQGQAPPAPTVEQLAAKIAMLERQYSGDSQLTASQIQKVYGTMGKMKQDLLKRTEQIKPPTIPQISANLDDFKELEEEFPHVRQHMVTSINRVLSRFNQTGEVPQTPNGTPIVEPQFQGQPQATAPQVQPQPTAPQPTQAPPPVQQGGNPSAQPTDEYENFNAEQQIASFEQQRAMHTLENLVPGAFQVIGEPGSTTPFRQWMSQQAADYQATVMGTWNPHVMAASIQNFYAQQGQLQQGQAQTQPARQQAPPQSQRFVAATQPTGNGGNPPAQAEPTEEDLINAGYEEAS